MPAPVFIYPPSQVSTVDYFLGNYAAFQIGSALYAVVVGGDGIDIQKSTDGGNHWSLLLNLAAYFNVGGLRGAFSVSDGVDKVTTVVSGGAGTNLSLVQFSVSANTLAVITNTGPISYAPAWAVIFSDGSIGCLYYPNSGSANYSRYAAGVWTSPASVLANVLPATSNFQSCAAAVDGSGNVVAMFNYSGSGSHFKCGVVFDQNGNILSTVSNVSDINIPWNSSVVSAVFAGAVFLNGLCYFIAKMPEDQGPEIFTGNSGGFQFLLSSFQGAAIQPSEVSITSDGTTLYAAQWNATTGTAFQVWTSPDGVTWTEYDTNNIVAGSGEPVVCWYVPGVGLFYNDATTSLATILRSAPLPVVVAPSRKSAGGSTVQPRCCTLPWVKPERIGLAESDLATPPQAQRVFTPFLLPAPADANTHVIGQYQVPTGFYFDLDYLVLNFFGAGWVPGDGNVSFALDVNNGSPNAQGIPVKDYSPVLTPLGSLDRPWPFRPGVLSRFSPRDILRAKVTTNPLAISPGLPNQFFAAFVGHLYPVN